MAAQRTRSPLGVIVLASVLVLGVGVAAAKAQSDLRAQWAKSRHGYRLAAYLEGTADGRRGVAAGHCGRCHTEQGHLAWLPQLERGNPGPIVQPDGRPATVDFLVSIGLNRKVVQPVTCNACHRPDLSMRTKTKGYTPMLPAGFRAVGVGAGATCMNCHNSRNGAVIWNQTDPRRYTAPHTASQADVIMGKNAFFTDYGNNFISAHATATGDSCVTCHMRRAKNNASHTWKADTNACAGCHGKGVTAKSVQEPVHTMIHKLEDAMRAKILSAAAAGTIRSLEPFNPKTYDFNERITIDPSAIKEIGFAEIRGQSGVAFTMADGRRYSTQLGLLRDAAGRPSFPTADPLVRASWNYWLLEGDGSWGVHNPRFFRQVIADTLDALR